MNAMLRHTYTIKHNAMNAYSAIASFFSLLLMAFKFLKVNN